MKRVNWSNQTSNVHSSGVCLINGRPDPQSAFNDLSSKFWSQQSSAAHFSLHHFTNDNGLVKKVIDEQTAVWWNGFDGSLLVIRYRFFKQTCDEKYNKYMYLQFIAWKFEQRITEDMNIFPYLCCLNSSSKSPWWNVHSDHVFSPSSRWRHTQTLSRQA